MWQDTMAAAAAAAVEYLEIGADPNAESFYREMSAERIGQKPTGSIPGRMLPPMGVATSHPDRPFRQFP
jgi:hypothetical protein